MPLLKYTPLKEALGIEEISSPMPKAASAPDPIPDPVGLRCNFCGKSDHEVRCMVHGPALYICDECVRLCCEMLLGYGISLAEEISSEGSTQSVLTVNDAIDHARDVAASCSGEACAEEHAKLAAWLTELKERRETDDE